MLKKFALLDLCSYIFIANREIPEITMANAINGEVAESEGQENTVEMEEGNIPSVTLFKTDRFFHLA